MKTLWLDRPDALNAQNLALVTRLHQQLQTQGADHTLLAAQGQHFSVGGDVKALSAQNYRQFSEQYFRAKYALDLAWQQGQGNQSRVQGYCLGGGLGLAIGSDRIDCYGDAIFAMPEVAIGMVPDCGTVVALSDRLGPLADLLLLTGHRLTGEQAYQLGLVDDLLDDVPFTDVSAWQADAQRWQGLSLQTRWQKMPDWVVLANVSPLAVALTAHHLQHFRHRSRAQAMASEVILATNLLSLGEFTEGIAAKLIERRPPKWRYRQLVDVPEAVLEQLYEAR